jgi:TolA-binding protein
MKIDPLCVIVFVALSLAVALAWAQDDSRRPEPDDDGIVEQTAEQVLSQLDTNGDQQFDQHELQTVLKSLLSQIQELRREVRVLQQQCERLQRQPADVRITRKPVLLVPPDGGVYGGKYYPPQTSDK